MSTPSQPPGPTLKKRSVLLMILFLVLTLGFYIPFWFVSRSEALNRLNPRYQVSLSLCILMFAAIAAGILVSENIVITTDLAFVITYVVLAFRVKDILNSTLLKQREEQAAHQEEISGALTFFFGIFYLQHRINQLPTEQDITAS